MPLTPDEIKKLREEAGLSAEIPTPAQVSNTIVNKQRLEEFDKVMAESRATKRKEERNIGQKILDFTGGKELTQGLGQALNMKRAGKQLKEVQEQQFQIQGNLIKQIKDKKVLGEDTSRLEKALEDLNLEVESTGESAERTYLNQNELTNKQVVGDALQLATTVSAGKIAGGAAKVAGKVTGGGVGALRGAARGLIAGASSGALIGASEGAAQGLQEDKDAKGIASSAGKGALLGGVTGGAIGTVAGGISGGVQASRIKKANVHIDAVTPNVDKLSEGDYRRALSQGKIKPKTHTATEKYILSEDEIATAKRYKHLLKGKDPAKNTINVMKEITRQDEEVGKFLDKNNGIFNTGELKNSILKRLEDVDDLTVDEKRLINMKLQTTDNFIKSLEKNDMKTLWQARKKFDKQIEKAFSGSPTLQKTVQKEFRNAVQDFIADRTPDDVYKGSMKEMSKLFNLKDVLETKAASERKLSGIAKWAKENPNAAKVLGGLTIAGAGTLIASKVAKAAD